MSDRAYYIDDFSDEMLPCESTLEGWAVWLSKPDDGWGRDDAAKPGDVFFLTSMDFLPDMIATYATNGWVIEGQHPEEPALVARRFGPGLGWGPHEILWEKSASVRQMIIDDLINLYGDTANVGDQEFYAIGVSGPKFRGVYGMNDGVPFVSIEVLQ